MRNVASLGKVCHSERSDAGTKSKNLRIIASAKQFFSTKILRLAMLAQDDNPSATALTAVTDSYTKKFALLAAVRTSFLFQTKSLVETIDTSTGVNQLLLAGIERVALGADLNTDLLLSGTTGKSVTAVAANGCLFVVGMDAFLHFVHLFLVS